MRRVVAILAVGCLVLGAAMAATPDPGTEEQRAAGKELYDKYCAQCHGVDGDGRGHATLRVKPAPRDFTVGKYKFRTTSSGLLPTDDDIRRVIREGLPYTSMPGWPQFTDAEVRNIIYYLKTFSEDFQDPEKLGDAIPIPDPPPTTEESIAQGRELYVAQGCAACHGDLGRGDGNSSPLLKDDWGDHIKAADMSMPWTFRGGPTRQDMFRTFTTGLNGTPMPAYEEVLGVEDRWHLVNYMVSLGAGEEPGYADLLVVTPVDDEIDLAEAEELFEAAPTARFPLLGQIVEPGRAFYPPTTSIEIQGVYNRTEIAFRVRWHDMRAETSGDNSPMLEAPPWEAEHGAAAGAADEEAEEDDFWGDEGEAEDDIWGEEEGTGDEDDFWAEEGEDDFWGEGDEGGALSADQEFSDAFALQFPNTLPTGIRKPYFIMGDTHGPVELWFVDLADKVAEQFLARGSRLLAPTEGEEIEVRAGYDRGEWTLLYKRARSTRGQISFEENQFVPLSFAVWDGFSRDHGNKRAISRWFYLYLQPREVPSPVGPMIRTAIVVLLIELIIVFYIRRRHATAPATATPQDTDKALGGATG
jgi:mono/diheme cytochrome c family protein